MEGRCERHTFEAAEGICRHCGYEFCHECLVYSYGAKRPPYCVKCAIAVAGVRSTAGHTPRASARDIKKEMRARKKEGPREPMAGGPVSLDWDIPDDEPFVDPLEATDGIGGDEHAAVPDADAPGKKHRLGWHKGRKRSKEADADDALLSVPTLPPELTDAIDDRPALIDPSRSREPEGADGAPAPRAAPPVLPAHDPSPLVIDELEPEPFDLHAAPLPSRPLAPIDDGGSGLTGVEHTAEPMALEAVPPAPATFDAPLEPQPGFTPGPALASFDAPLEPQAGFTPGPAPATFDAPLEPQAGFTPGPAPATFDAPLEPQPSFTPASATPPPAPAPVAVNPPAPAPPTLTPPPVPADVTPPPRLGEPAGAGRLIDPLAPDPTVVPPPSAPTPVAAPPAAADPFAPRPVVGPRIVDDGVAPAPFPGPRADDGLPQRTPGAQLPDTAAHVDARPAAAASAMEAPPPVAQQAQAAPQGWPAPPPPPPPPAPPVMAAPSPPVAAPAAAPAAGKHGGKGFWRLMPSSMRGKAEDRPAPDVQDEPTDLSSFPGLGPMGPPRSERPLKTLAEMRPDELDDTLPSVSDLYDRVTDQNATTL